MTTSKRAVILLSGGLDSTTVFYQMKDKFNLHPLHIGYGQRHLIERQFAEETCRKYGLPLEKYDLPGLPWAKSSLTDKSIPVPNNSLEKIGEGIPNTFVAGRNIIMLSLAASYAYFIGAKTILTGFNVLDYSGYPDCRPEFTESMQSALTRGLAMPVKIMAPLIKKTKKQIKKIADSLNFDWRENTWSCYNPQPNGAYKFGFAPCGVCDSCKLRDAK